MSAINPVVVPQTKSDKLDAGWRYVTVPAFDIYEYKFPGIDINRDHYGPGTHLVAPDVATELEAILKRAAEADIRLLRPRPRKADQVAVNRTLAGEGHRPATPAELAAADAA